KHLLVLVERSGCGPRRATTTEIVRRTSEMRGAVLLVMVLVAGRAAGEESLLSGAGTRGGHEPGLTLVSALPRSGGQTRPTSYVGTYSYVGTDAEKAAVKGAVDRATEHMFGKVIARQELMKRSDIRPSYTIRLEPAGTVCVETPGFPSERSPLDGTEVE